MNAVNTIFNNGDFRIEEIQHTGGDIGEVLVEACRDELAELGRTIVLIIDRDGARTSVVSIPTADLPNAWHYADPDEGERRLSALDGVRAALATAQTLLPDAA